jgi:hypothetical protein
MARHIVAVTMTPVTMTPVMVANLNKKRGIDFRLRRACRNRGGTRRQGTRQKCSCDQRFDEHSVTSKFVRGG